MAKSAKKRREHYENGAPGEVYGIWNGIEKRFVFGIREPTPKLAEQKHRQLCPIASRCYRYSWKAIPKNWENPKNQTKY